MCVKGTKAFIESLEWRLAKLGIDIADFMTRLEELDKDCIRIFKEFKDIEETVESSLRNEKLPETTT